MSNNRKRSRDDMDSDECLPISKRINRLQIGNSSSGLVAVNGEPPPVNNNLHKGIEGEPPWADNGESSGWQSGHHSYNQLSPGADYSSIRSNGSFPVNTHLNSHYPASDIVPSTSNNPQCSNNQLAPNFADQRNSFGQLNAPDLEENEVYEPELSRGENPHYYAANEILHNAHVMRNSRQIDTSKVKRL